MLIGALTLVTAVAAVATYVVVTDPFGSPPTGAAAPRARVYRDVDVCLLTGPGGLAADPARTAWQALQGLSRTGSARVSYVSVPAPDSTKAAAPVLAGLVQRRCAVVVAAGTAEAAAVDAAAARSHDVHFVTVGTAAGARHANVVRLRPAELGSRLADAVRPLIGV